MRSIATKATAFVALTTAIVAIPASTYASNNVLAINNSAGNTLGKQIAQANTAKEADKAEASQPAAKPEVKVTVAEGDSLSSIAEKYQTTWVRIFNANESIADPNVINPGQELRIPAADEQLADRALPVAAPVVTTGYSSGYSAPRTVSRPAAAYPVDANSAKAFIYSRESGNNPNATNPNGCYGIGQDCNGRVRSSCGADYACQDQYFTNYAMARYGSWENAQVFWNSHGWW